ncbi:MAG TPA: hypothetical protein VKZ53_08690 [Candidatus Angelobacter sp.]|nr:hypothetical protein [Candidatus Angelobacter sp.]
MANQQNNRVLIRLGARELTVEEVNKVAGGIRIHTATLCSIDPETRTHDGDVGEC